MIEDFIKQQKKASQPRKQKVTNSYGLRDAYMYIRDHKWFNIGSPLSEKQFSSIVKGVNKRLAQNVLDSIEVKFPYKMGALIVRKTPRKVWFKNGKVRTNLIIDWNATLQLWYNDLEARKNKTLVRREAHDLFKIHYDKTKTDYQNAWVYDFRPTRELKVLLQKKAAEGKLDGFLASNYDKKY